MCGKYRLPEEYMCEIQIYLTSWQCLLIMPKELVFLSLTFMHKSAYSHACVYVTKLHHSPNHLSCSSLNLSIDSGKMLSNPHSVAALVIPWPWRTYAGLQLSKMPLSKQPQLPSTYWTLLCCCPGFLPPLGISTSAELTHKQCLTLLQSEIILFSS